MSTLIDLLVRQHTEVLARIDRDVGNFDDPQVAGAFLDFLENDVVSHFRLEEDLLFPELAAVPSIAGGPLRVMNAEHAAFRDLLAAGKDARERREHGALATAATDLAALLRAHIAKENQVLFPMSLDALSPEQLRRIDAACPR
jgi:hemerythrin-like domain-containing protein